MQVPVGRPIETARDSGLELPNGNPALEQSIADPARRQAEQTRGFGPNPPGPLDRLDQTGTLRISARFGPHDIADGNRPDCSGPIGVGRSGAGPFGSRPEGQWSDFNSLFALDGRSGKGLKLSISFQNWV